MSAKNISGFFIPGILLLLGVVMIAPTEAAIQENSMHPGLRSPWRAILSPQGGRLEVKETTPILEKNGFKTIEFVIPESAANLNIQVSGETIIRWASTPVPIGATSGSGASRQRLQQEKNNLEAALDTVEARIAMWTTQTAPASSEDLEKRQSLMNMQLPELAKNRDSLRERIGIMERQLAKMPAAPQIAQKISVTISGPTPAGSQAEIAYSYDFMGCGWEAAYDFDAVTGNGQEEGVKVRMLASAWQNSGIDWQGTQIVLASQGNGAREPRPLPKWIVGETAQPAPQPRTYSLRAKQATLATGLEGAVAMDEAAPLAANAPVRGDTTAIYATWTLEAKGLPEGRSQVVILEDVWKTSLEWLARPTINEGRVWLLAKCDLPAEQAWPAGKAQFSLNGQNIGEGFFAPKGRETTLYFGTDPRVSVITTEDASKSGQTGFINTSKTWTGAWTYTIHNEHDQEIRVKVERPAPMVANEQISVTFKDNPPSTLDEKQHMVYWDVTVPAHGKTVIEHSVLISSPEKLPIFPAIQ